MKYITLSIVLFIAFNFLEYGLNWNGIDKFLIPGALSVASILCFFVAKSRKILLTLSVTLLGIMVLLYLFDNLALSNRIGSFGFALFVILIISYLPTLIKKGYIQKI